MECANIFYPDSVHERKYLPRKYLPVHSVL